MTIEEFKEKCRHGGIQYAKTILKKYIDDDQPEDFCRNYTSRALCREASNAITGESADFFDSKYGIVLYHYMWNDIDFEP